MSGTSWGRLVGRRLAQRAVLCYYPKTESSGRERIPVRGPVLFVTGGPATSVDVALVSVAARRAVWFRARGQHQTPLLGALLRALGWAAASGGAAEFRDEEALVKTPTLPGLDSLQGLVGEH